MARQIWYAFVAGGVVLLVALIYTDVPTILPADDTSGAAASVVHIGDRVVSVTIASMPEERERGLSGRESLAPDEGMLFVFDKDGYHAFWMKDMRFSIDIIWISHSGEIVDIEQSVSPESYPAAFAPRTKARYVLELPAGYAEAYNVRVGGIVRL